MRRAAHEGALRQAQRRGLTQEQGEATPTDAAAPGYFYVLDLARFLAAGGVFLLHLGPSISNSYRATRHGREPCTCSSISSLRCPAS